MNKWKLAFCLMIMLNIVAGVFLLTTNTPIDTIIKSALLTAFPMLL